MSKLYRIYGWLIILALVVGAHACSAPDDLEHNTETDRWFDLSASFPDSRIAITTPTALPSLTPTSLPSATPESLHPALPIVDSLSSPVSTPFPDEQEIIHAVLGTKTGKHWIDHLVSGSFTAPSANERLALVGNIGDDDEIRSVVIGETKNGWQLLGTSEWRGAGFYSPPSFYLPPNPLDFDRDGQQEILDHYFRTQQGWTVSADTIYRWDGHRLARVWRANVVSDNTMADRGDVSHSYRQNYRATWEWVDLDDDDVDDILLQEHVIFHQTEKPPLKDDETVLGEETWERAFRWDGEAFRPSAPEGPSGTFAYTALGDLWLWQDRIARPLGEGHVREIHWSPDGLRLAWWAQPPTGNGSPGTVLGILDRRTDTYHKFYLQSEISALRWTPGGHLVYALADQSLALFDPKTGEQKHLSASFGTWSPGGGRMVYERDGNLYAYDLSTDQNHLLVITPGDGKNTTPVDISNPVWSPRGNWIACLVSLANPNSTGVGLIAPGLAEPLNSDALLNIFGGWQASNIQFAWSPNGSHLAALTTDPDLGQQPTALYLAEVPLYTDPPERYPVQLEWQRVLQLDVATQSARLAWSPASDRVTLAVGNDIWEVAVPRQTQTIVVRDAVLRHHFSVPEPKWTVLEWAPDGSGFLVGMERPYDEHLYWFPTDGAEPTLLLADSLGTAHWTPRTVPRFPMVLVEHTDDIPLIHFVAQDGSDTTILARGAEYHTSFQVSNGRVYHERSYVDQSGGVSLSVPDMLADCRSPMVSPDGSQLAWLCDDGPPDIYALTNGSAQVRFQLIVTDDQGRDPVEMWSYIETGPVPRDIRLMRWRADGKVIYLSQPKYGVAYAYFDYNPGILALDVDTGQVTQIGDLDGIHDGLVNSDGTWLVQSRAAKWPSTGVSITLRSLINGSERSIACADGFIVAGDFSFSPDNTWVAWREWGTAGQGMAHILIRALRLPDGEPLAVYEEIESAAPQIGGWLQGGDLVLVYSMWGGGGGDTQENHAGGPFPENTPRGHSTVVALPSTGPGTLFSPFTFLDILRDLP